MTLKEVFEKAKLDGFRYAKNKYSFYGRRIDKWKDYIEKDKHDYTYKSFNLGTDLENAWAVQNNKIQLDSWEFWRE